MAEDTTEATPADVLRDAAKVLRERGWCQHQSSDNQGRVCAVGALWDVTECMSGWADSKARKVLATFLGLHVSDDGSDGIPEWNDTIATDGEQVAQTMEKAAAAWEEVAGLD